MGGPEMLSDLVADLCLLLAGICMDRYHLSSDSASRVLYRILTSTEGHSKLHAPLAQPGI